ncbi:MFS transporter [Streptomyces sp. NRRL S-920]|uniref:MFS transporter n=1 Tax=Streptomyces sp. NRRL S-920 TaxID=1463921 RepID=UPI001F43E561|nr:MFS transporter [Streptomyces sp. NRRL S-920]
MSLANAVGRGAFVTASTLYFTRIVGLSLAELGTGLTAAAVCGLLSGVPFGYLADWRGPRVTAAILLALAAFVSIWYLVVDSFWPFVVCACLISVFQGGGSAARQAALAKVVQGAEAVTTRAYLRAIGNVGMGVGSGLAGIALAFDTRTAYLCVMGLNALCLTLCPLIILRLPRSLADAPGNAARRPALPPLSVLRDAPYAAVTLINAIMMVHFQITEIALPLWLARHTQAPASMVAALVLLNTASVVIFQVRVSRGITTVAHAVRSWRRSGLTLLLACLVFAASAAGSATTAGGILVVAAVAHVYGEMVQSAAAALLSYDLAPADQHGQYQGFFNTGMSFSQMIAPAVLIPLTVAWGVYGWVVLGGLFLITGLAMGPAVRWAQRRQTSASTANSEAPA